VLRPTGEQGSRTFPCFYLISAPVLNMLLWVDSYDMSSVQLGELTQLRILGIFCYTVGPNDATAALSKIQSYGRSRRVMTVLPNIMFFGFPGPVPDPICRHHASHAPGT
jgi:hypothetical protein